MKFKEKIAFSTIAPRRFPPQKPTEKYINVPLLSLKVLRTSPCFGSPCFCPLAFRSDRGVRLDRLAPDRMVEEAAFPDLHWVVDVAPVEDHRLAHQGLHQLEVGLAELVPLGDDDQRVRPLEGSIGGFGVPEAVPAFRLHVPHRLGVENGNGRLRSEQLIENVEDRPPRD